MITGGWLKAIINANVVLENGILWNGAIVVKNDKIIAVDKEVNLEIPENAEIIDAQGAYVGPGFVDIHVHGGGVTLSGSECLMQADFCAELLKKLKEHNINTAVDTCGFVSREAIKKVIPHTDVFLYDLKAYDEDIHIKCTGYSNKNILENLKYIDDSGAATEIRIPYVPEYNSEQIEKNS